MYHSWRSTILSALCIRWYSKRLHCNGIPALEAITWTGSHFLSKWVVFIFLKQLITSLIPFQSFFTQHIISLYFDLRQIWSPWECSVSGNKTNFKEGCIRTAERSLRQLKALNLFIKQMPLIKVLGKDVGSVNLNCAHKPRSFLWSLFFGVGGGHKWQCVHYLQD